MADNTEGLGILIRPWVKKYVNGVALNGVPVRTPQIDSATKNWLVFEPISNAYVDTGIYAEGQEGQTPAIGANGNWWIGGIDTGQTALACEIELIADATHIKWRYTGDTDWTNLVALDDLKGDNGEDGEDGENGETPEFRMEVVRYKKSCRWHRWYYSNTYIENFRI